MTWPEAFATVGVVAVVFGFFAFIVYAIFRWL